MAERNHRKKTKSTTESSDKHFLYFQNTLRQNIKHVHKYTSTRPDPTVMITDRSQTDMCVELHKAGISFTSSGVDDLDAGGRSLSQHSVFGVFQGDSEGLMVFLQTVVYQVNVPGLHTDS